ncbi:MAG: WecB/TagA/CpsF family glycosyltransferase [Deltaproteobacteria bacterium]|nr:WecB/TagA/CpsF family glycosyltransferase [Deltaproteobacteria bacterium]
MKSKIAQKNKSLPTTQNTVGVFGVNIAPLTEDSLFEDIKELIKDDTRHLVTYANIHTMNSALFHPDVLRLYQKSSLTYCDGAGVVWGAKLLGQYLPKRMTSASFIHEFCNRWQQDGTRLFFLGGEPNVAMQACSELEMRYPGLQICGHHHGFFKDSDETEIKLFEQISQMKPDILFVGLGTPRQEQWTLKNFSRLDAKVIWPIGALVDYLSGKVPRCPQWMQESDLEWLFRLYVEPRRMFRRYVLGNPFFITRILIEKIRRHHDR